MFCFNSTRFPREFTWFLSDKMFHGWLSAGKSQETKYCSSRIVLMLNLVVCWEHEGSQARHNNLLQEEATAQCGFESLAAGQKFDSVSTTSDVSFVWTRPLGSGRKDQENSRSDISSWLHVPLNRCGYNLSDQFQEIYSDVFELRTDKKSVWLYKNWCSAPAHWFLRRKSRARRSTRS